MSARKSARTDGPRIPMPSKTPSAGIVRHGRTIKNFAESEEPGRYGPPVLVDTKREAMTGRINKKTICTSHVERNNLSIRTFIRRFTRLSLGFSKKLANLNAAVSLHFAYYNFCWFRGSLRKTPATAAKIAGHPWSLEELFDAIQ